MELTLYRSYFKQGTNGALFLNERFLSHTIELPWRNNQRNVSCIPEGIYEIRPRFSERFKNHLILKDVPRRSLILFHPANDALTELEGCIAPVTYLNGIGKGVYSRRAMNQLLSLVHQANDRNENLSITIKSHQYEYCKTLSKTHTKVL